jgi:hypothetical protein
LVANKAYEIYGQATPPGQYLEAIPRSKYNFGCRLIGIPGTVELERIASVTMPSVSMKTSAMNSYNRKVIVQTGYDYSPVVLVAYDTKDAAIENFLKGYMNYYYKGPMNTESFNEHQTQGKGYKLQDDRNYIKQFVIERKSGEDNNTITLWNPFIQSIDADTLDYSDSGLVQYRITFMYESFETKSE